VKIGQARQVPRKLQGNESDGKFNALTGAETVAGGAGGAGNDRIYGQSGNDSLSGETGNDTMLGNADSDTIFFWGGYDRLHGDHNAVTYEKNHTFGDDAIYRGAGQDQLLGYAGNDLLHGDAAADTLFGGAGADTLYGGQGADTLYG
jgi:Ca2+-binding RTX toxin-like protein